MARIVEKEVVPVVESDGDSTASNAIWAVALIIIVALISLAVWKSGILRRVANPTQKVDVEVSVPAR